MMRPVTTALTDLRRLSFKYENNSRVIVTFWYADMIVSRYLLEESPPLFILLTLTLGSFKGWDRGIAAYFLPI